MFQYLSVRVSIIVVMYEVWRQKLIPTKELRILKRRKQDSFLRIICSNIKLISKIVIKYYSYESLQLQL